MTTLFSKYFIQPYIHDIQQYLFWREAGAFIFPDYQRDYIWSETQASRLIQTIFLKLPLPAIFTTDLKHGKPFEIVDGRQRLTTIFNFIDGKLKLNGDVKKDLQGLTYNDLTEVDKHKFLDTTITTMRLPTEITEKEKLEMFITINRGGTVMSDNDLAIALNKINNF